MNGLWKNHRLKKLDPELYRFKCKVMHETALALLLDIEGVQLWVPKKNTQVGIEPTGNYYAVDLPDWLVRKHHLI